MIPRKFWRRSGTILLAAGIGVLLLTGRPVPSANLPVAGPAAQTFEQMASAINAVPAYEAQWTHFSSTPGPRPIWTRTTVQGKFIRSPMLSYDKVLANENNFHDPVQPGTQRIFDSRPNELLVLLPGLLRMIGVIHLYPEDAKCVELNRETGVRASLWDNLADWRGLLTHGALSLRSEAEQGKNFPVVTLTWPVQTMGDQPEMSRLDIWVDPVTHLPRRYRGFVEGQPKAVMEFDYPRIAPNPSLKPEDIKFEGLALWSFPAQFVANGQGLENLRYPALAAASGTAPTFQKVLEQASAAVAKIKDYRAEFLLTQKYFRLKMRGKVAESVIKGPRFFLFEFDSDFRVNYLNLISPGGKLCFRRDERTYATMGGGAMRAAGVQVMYVDDHRSDFACGESFYHLNLFELVIRMKWYGEKGKVAVDLVKLGNKICPRVIMKRTTEPRAAEIQDMQVVFDPQTWLPLRVDYLGNPDPQGFTVIEYQGLKTNLGLKEAELKF